MGTGAVTPGFWRVIKSWVVALFGLNVGEKHHDTLLRSFHESLDRALRRK